MSVESDASALDETERLIVLAFAEIGQREVDHFRLCRITDNRLTLADLRAKREGVLSKYLLIFPSGLVKIRRGGEEQFYALVEAVRKLDKERVTNKTATHAESASPRPPRLDLLRWQKEALSAWQAAGKKGIIEAVTGSGKTYVAMGAILWAERATNPPVYPLVVVPTIVLMEQWYGRLVELFPDQRIARLGGGHKGDFSSPLTAAAVGVVNSLVQRNNRQLNRLLEHCKSGQGMSFLVADECHRYIDAPVFNRLLQFRFDWTMGLSATIAPYEVAGLGRVVYEYTFRDAFRDGLVPGFDLVNALVDLTPDERNAYLDLDERVRGARVHMLEEYPSFAGLHGDRFWQQLRQVMGKPGSHKAPTIERFYSLVFKRTAITYLAQEKTRLAVRLVHHLVGHKRKKVLVFFERIDSAEDVGEDLAGRAAEELRNGLGPDGPRCNLYHSRMNRNDQDRALSVFRNAGPSALLACRSLDEGLDIPDVDAAILVASTQSQRQRVQRIGRVLRAGPEGKRPLVVTLVVRGTNDRGVTQKDKDLFSEVATIHEVLGRDCVSHIASLDKNS